MKAIRIHRLIFGCVLAIGLCALGSGCETLGQQRAREEMRDREDTLMMQENVRRLTGRVETLEFEIERLQRELREVRDEAVRATRADMQALQNQIGDVEREVQAVDKARAKDRQEIVDTISAKMADVLKQASRSSSSGSGTRRSEYGYEHQVQPGQTLSEIAQAYGVSVKAIIEENNIKDPNRVRAGQVLFIPE